MTVQRFLAIRFVVMAAWAVALVVALVLGGAADEVWGSPIGFIVRSGLLVAVIAGGLVAQKFLLQRIDPRGELRAAVARLASGQRR